MNEHVIAMRWKINSSITPPTAYLLVWSNGGVENFPLGLGMPFDVSISKERSCRGYLDPSSRQWVPCKQMRSGEAECAECRSRGGGFYIPHKCSSSSNSCRAYCFAPYSVYLALIANVPKVGITRFTRKYDRFFESGATEVRIILLEENRMKAADIERAISSKFRVLGVREQVRITRNNITSFLRTPTQETVSSFRKLCLDIEKWLIKERYKVPKPEHLDDSDLYYPSVMQVGDQVSYTPITERISGEIVFLKGSIMVVKDSEGLKAFELDSLRGRFIERLN